MTDEKISKTLERGFYRLAMMTGCLLISASAGFGVFWIVFLMGGWGILGAQIWGLIVSADVMLVLTPLLNLLWNKKNNDGARKSRDGRNTRS